MEAATTIVCPMDGPDYSAVSASNVLVPNIGSMGGMLPLDLGSIHCGGVRLACGLFAGLP